MWHAMQLGPQRLQDQVLLSNTLLYVIIQLFLCSVCVNARLPAQPDSARVQKDAHWQRIMRGRAFMRAGPRYPEPRKLWIIKVVDHTDPPEGRPRCACVRTGSYDPDSFCTAPGGPNTHQIRSVSSYGSTFVVCNVIRFQKPG